MIKLSHHLTIRQRIYVSAGHEVGHGFDFRDRLRNGPVHLTLARFVSVALSAAVAAMCTSCNPGGTPPPAGMAVSAQTSVSYSDQLEGGFPAQNEVWSMTLQGQHYGPNAQVTIKSSNVPGKSGTFTFGSATTGQDGSFTFSTSGSPFTSDRSNWNVDVHVTAEENDTGWFQVAEMNGGVFVNCLPAFPTNQWYSLTVAVPDWVLGSGNTPPSYSCPQIPPPSGGGGSGGGTGGGGLGGCPSAGDPGCVCKAGGTCNTGLVCVYGSTCIACGGYGQPCCSGNSCSGSLSCKYSPAQNTNSCLP